MAAKNSIELWVVLTNPVEARRYIERFDWGVEKHFCPTEITLNSGRTINFSQMTDEDAVVAALELLRSFEIPMVMKTKQLAQWEH